MRPEFLNSLIKFKNFNDVTSIEELKDSILENWLRQKAGSTVEGRTPELLEIELRKHFKLNTKEEDLELRIMNLFSDYDTFLTRRNLRNLDTENMKLAIGHICKTLRPTTLRCKIESDLSLHKENLKHDWMEFYNYVLSKVVTCDS